MIDFENQILGLLLKPLREKFKGVFITGEAVSTVQKQFPAVSIVQRSNITLSKTQDIGCFENHAIIMLEVDVYSNLTTGKKQQAKLITTDINDILTSYNFTRTFCEPIENLSDTTIYRIKSRYTAVIGKNGCVYTK